MAHGKYHVITGYINSFSCLLSLSAGYNIITLGCTKCNHHMWLYHICQGKAISLYSKENILVPYNIRD